MNLKKLREYYESNVIRYTEILHKTERKLNTVVLLRLLVFVSGSGIVILLVRNYGWNFLFLSIPFIGLFLFLIKKHEDLKYRKKYAGNCVIINRQELNALTGDQSVFEDGSCYFDPSHFYSSDMDVFGKNSLFQYINRTVTSGGSEILAQWLMQKSSNDEILQRQLSVKELGLMADLRLDFRATGMMKGDDKNDREEILGWIREENHFFGKSFFQISAIVLPAVVLISLLLSFFIIPVNLFF